MGALGLLLKEADATTRQIEKLIKNKEYDRALDIMQRFTHSGESIKFRNFVKNDKEGYTKSIYEGFKRKYTSPENRAKVKFVKSEAEAKADEADGISRKLQNISKIRKMKREHLIETSPEFRKMLVRHNQLTSKARLSNKEQKELDKTFEKLNNMQNNLKLNEVSDGIKAKYIKRKVSKRTYDPGIISEKGADKETLRYVKKKIGANRFYAPKNDKINIDEEAFNKADKTFNKTDKTFNKQPNNGNSESGILNDYEENVSKNKQSNNGGSSSENNSYEQSFNPKNKKEKTSNENVTSGISKFKIGMGIGAVGTLGYSAYRSNKNKYDYDDN